VPVGCIQTALSMFSRCPNCNTQQAITTQQLRQTRGLVTCEVCRASFDALPSLTESKDDAFTAKEQTIDSLNNGKNPPAAIWGIGNAWLLMLLLGQLVFFQGAELLRYPRVYSAVVGVYQRLGYQAPAYQNVSMWSVSHSDLQAQLDRHYWLTAALTNQTEWVQTLPVLKLSLTNYKGQIVAERLFTPQQYSNTLNATAGQTMAVRIPLLLSASPGGFTLSPV